MKLAEIAYLEKLRLPLKLNALDGLAVVQFKCIRRHTHGFCFIPVFNNLGEVLHSLFGSFGYNSFGDYAWCQTFSFPKSSNLVGEEKYRVKKTYDDEGFCITRELVKQ